MLSVVVVVVVVVAQELGVAVVLVVKVTNLAAIVKDKQSVVQHVDSFLKASTAKLDALTAILKDVQDKESIAQYDLEDLGPIVGKMINDAKAKLKDGKSAKAGLMTSIFDVDVYAGGGGGGGGWGGGWLAAWVGGWV